MHFKLLIRREVRRYVNESLDSEEGRTPRRQICVSENVVKIYWNWVFIICNETNITHQVYQYTGVRLTFRSILSFMFLVNHSWSRGTAQYHCFHYTFSIYVFTFANLCLNSSMSFLSVVFSYLFPTCHIMYNNLSDQVINFFLFRPWEESWYIFRSDVSYFI